MRRKLKQPNIDPRQKLTADFVAALQADWDENGPEIIKALRTKAPTKYAEIIAHFATPDPFSDPDQLEYSSTTTHEDIGRALLRNVGCDESLITDELVKLAVEMHDKFVSTLVAIVTGEKTAAASDVRN